MPDEIAACPELCSEYADGGSCRFYLESMPTNWCPECFPKGPMTMQERDAFLTWFDKRERVRVRESERRAEAPSSPPSLRSPIYVYVGCGDPKVPPAHRTTSLNPPVDSVLADYGEAGQLIGIEFLAAERFTIEGATVILDELETLSRSTPYGELGNEQLEKIRGLVLQLVDLIGGGGEKKDDEEKRSRGGGGAQAGGGPGKGSEPERPDPGADRRDDRGDPDRLGPPQLP